jgi:hypothetical protein
MDITYIPMKRGFVNIRAPAKGCSRCSRSICGKRLAACGIHPPPAACLARMRGHFAVDLKYLKSGGAWFFLAGIRSPSPLRK